MEDSARVTSERVKELMNERMKLSIIIPIFKVEAYLRKCVESVLSQDLPSSEYEIILVDDGSPDGCPAICDEYARKSQELRAKSQEYPLIRVVHRENGGLSAARNSGIEIAQGKYIMFVDSDDYLDPNVLGYLVRTMEEKQLDVLRYKHQYVRVVTSERMNVERAKEYEVYNPYKGNPFKGNDYSEVPTDGVSFLNSRMSTACYAWAFIILRDLIISDDQSPMTTDKCEKDNILFTPGIYFEDTDWTPRMLVRAKRVASTNLIVYNYLLTRQGSITNAVNRTKQKKVLDDKMRLIGEMQRQAKELREKGLDATWFDKMIAATITSIIGILSADFYAERKTYLDQLNQYGVFPICNIGSKAKLINISPKLVVWLMHIKQWQYTDKIREFIRFGIVGVLVTGIHYGLYCLLNLIMNVNVAYTIGYVVALCCNFYLTAHFTFKTRTSAKRGVGFVVSHGINYVLHIVLLNFFLWLGLSETWAPVPVFCIAIPVNFIFIRYVFTSKYFNKNET